MPKSNFLYSLLAVFTGTALYQQYRLFQYFYSSKWDDIILLAVIFFLSYFMASRFLSLREGIKKSILYFILLYGVLMAPLSYHTYQEIDLVGWSTYLFISAFSVCISQKENSTLPILKNILTYCFFLIIGVAIQHFIDHHYVLTGLAIIVILFDQFQISETKILNRVAPAVLIALIVFITFSSFQKGIIFYEKQSKYYDKLVFSQETPFQTIDITEYKGQQWFYYNGKNHFSTIDQWLYYEPLVHPVMNLQDSNPQVLVIGGDNGIAIKELQKYPAISNITHLQIDSALYRLAIENPYFTRLNDHVFELEYINSQRTNIFNFLHTHQEVFDVIIVDIPDPLDLEMNQYYTLEFYKLCRHALKSNGSMITQAGSPYFATEAFYCISNTIKTAGLSILPLHNQILTVGEWGWIMASKGMTGKELSQKVSSIEFSEVNTTWINNEAINMMLSFGKKTIKVNDSLINTIKKPVVHTLYTAGNWNLN